MSVDVLRAKALIKIAEIMNEFAKLKEEARNEQEIEDLENLESIFIGTKEVLEKKI
jgi:hypothetical protein